jgi:hypothetical protein
VQRIRQAVRNIKTFLQSSDRLPEPPTQKGRKQKPTDSPALAT